MPMCTTGNKVRMDGGEDRIRVFGDRKNGEKPYSARLTRLADGRPDVPQYVGNDRSARALRADADVGVRYNAPSEFTVDASRGSLMREAPLCAGCRAYPSNARAMTTPSWSTTGISPRRLSRVPVICRAVP